MRKSLQKTPPSELSSKLALLPDALLAAAAARQVAAKANGRSTNVRRPQVQVAPAEGDQVAARLRLLEGFISRTEVADCAQHALQWLADERGVARSMCIVR